MVYQGFRLLKRNPTFYNPRSAGMVVLAYMAYSIYSVKIQRPLITGFDDYNENHPHTYDEKLRQFHEKQNALIRQTVQEQREEYQAKLKAEARI